MKRDINAGGGTNYEAFSLGLYVPTVATDDGTPKRADQLGYPVPPTSGAAITHPDRIHRQDTDLWPWESDPWWVGADERSYQLRIPAIVWWTCTLSPQEFGEVVFKIKNEPKYLNPTFAPGADHGGPTIKNQPQGTRTIYLTPKYDPPEENITAPNFFRRAGLPLSVEFRDSRLADLAPSNPIETTVEYVTPNRGVLNVDKVLAGAETTYSNGLRAAGRLRTVKGAGLLRRVARLAAYTQAQRSRWPDAITESELVNRTAIRGLSGFQQELQRIPERAYGSQVNLVPAGPTIAFRTER